MRDVEMAREIYYRLSFQEPARSTGEV
jgi:hypothetical protein